MSALVLKNVSKQYETRAEPLQILRDVSIELSAGENLAILGPSGSGKSTLLHIAGTLDAPTSGTVRFDDTDPFALGAAALARFRNHKIGFVFQDHHLLPQLSVLENVLMPTLALGRPDQAAVQWANELIERVGLSERIDHLPSELSGGERGRVAIARSMVCRPSLLLADEPTGNLDQSTARSVGQLLLDIQRDEHTMLIVVTHSQELASGLDRKQFLDDGRLRAP